MDKQSEKILIIDNDEDHLSLFQVMLQTVGYSVVAVGSGKQGLVCLSEDRFALVICDVMMPEMSGPEFVRELRGNPDYQHTKVVLLTAGRIDLDNSKINCGEDALCLKRDAHMRLIPLVAELLSNS